MNDKEYNHPAYINVPYFILQDKRLDFFNKFLFSLLWSFSVSGKKIIMSNSYLADLFKVSERYIQIRLKDLEDLGVIRRYQVKLKRYIEVIYVTKVDIEGEENHNNFETRTTVGTCTNLEQTRTTVGISHEQQIVTPRTTVHTYIKEDIKEDNKDIYIPDLKKSGITKIKDYKKDERFMRFYNAYPKKVDPHDAWKAFKSIVGNDDVLLAEILNDIELRKQKHSQWRDNQYIKYPAVYLRKGEYLGEIYNSEAELKEKKERDRLDNENRQSEQERLSQLRADTERKNNESKYRDGVAYRQIKKESVRVPMDRPKGLQDLLKEIRLQ